MSSPEIQPRQRGRIEKLFMTAGKITAVGAFAIGATALVIEALDPTEQVLNYKGESHLVHLGDQVSMPIVRDIPVYAGGDAHQDVTLMPDSNAYNRGLFLQNIEYVPSGMLELQAFEDDKLGFYVLMSEFDESTQTSKEFDYSSLLTTTRQPFHCDFSLEDGNDGEQLVPHQECLDYMNNDPDGWHGIEHSSFAKGGFFGTRLGNTPPTKARYMTDEHLENNWCNYGLRFGKDEDLVFWDSDAGRYKISGVSQFRDGVPYIPEEDVFEGARDRIIALYRKIASDSTGLTLTKSNGMPIFLTQSQRDYLLEIADEHGSFRDMDEEKYRSVMQLEFALEGNLDHEPGKIDIDRPVAYDLIDLKKKYPDIQISGVTTSDDWTEEGNEMDYVLNYNCLPLGKEGLTEYSEEVRITNAVASYTGIVPGAILADDPMIDDSSETMSTIYINGNSRSLFSDTIQEVLPEEEVMSRIISYKKKHEIDLTPQEVNFINSQNVAQQESTDG